MCSALGLALSSQWRRLALTGRADARACAPLHTSDFSTSTGEISWSRRGGKGPEWTARCWTGPLKAEDNREGT
jgi:hypothetical protein